MSYLLLKPPHRDALFSLVPCNEHAKAAVALPDNAPLRTTLNDVSAITVDLTNNAKTNRTLISLGRLGADIVLPKIKSLIQCAFELHPDYNGYIMLHDHSRWQTTQIFGDDVRQFQSGRPRRIIIQQGENMIIGMGRKCDLFKFAVVSYVDVEHVAERLQALGLTQNSTIASFNGGLGASSLNRAMATRERRNRIRYSTIELLGAGGFGQVQKCVDVDSGRVMAVKSSMGAYVNPRYLQVMHREIETLSAVSHENIVEFFGSQESETGSLEFFMAIKDGSAEDLFEWRYRPHNLAKDAMTQILRALAYLDSHSLIHRDVKPGNILYSSGEDGRYKFYLADFGMTNWVDSAYTCCGTPLFRAPEVWKDEEQSTKVDIWSLFVTFLWLANTRGFRTASILARPAWTKIQIIGYEKGVSKTVRPLRDMGNEYPDIRPSASQALRLLEESE